MNNSACRQIVTVGMITLLIAVPAIAQQANSRVVNQTTRKDVAQPRKVAFVKAVVIDDRLSALRREPNLQSEIVHRLRIGRPVYLIRTIGDRSVQTEFCRVAVSRRTRGWMLASALAVPSRAGEDERIMKLIASTKDGVERIALGRILVERFPQSHLVPRALVLIGGEAERAAKTLSVRAKKRLADVPPEQQNPSLRVYYLNDAGLDRYNKLGIAF